MGAGGAARPPSLPHPCFPPPALLSLSLCSARRQVAGLVGLLPFLPLSLFLSFPSLSSLSYLLPGCRAGLAGGCPAHQAVVSLGWLADTSSTPLNYANLLFSSLSLPLALRGPLAEPPPVLIHIHNCVAGDGHACQIGAGGSATMV